MSRETSNFARKLSILLLSFMMCLSQLPQTVFALDETGTEPAETEIVNESDDDSVPEALAQIETIEEDTDETTLGIDDNDELFNGFVDNAFKGLTEAEIHHIGGTASIQSNENKLSGLELTIYRFLAGKVTEVSSSSLTNTVFSLSIEELGLSGPFTAADLGVSAIVANGAISAEAKNAYSQKLEFDSGLVLDALRSDYPYDLFWYDKTEQTITERSRKYSASYNEETDEYELSVSGAITISMPVAEAYSASGTSGTFELSNVVEKVQISADNAQTIVQNNAGLEDYEKVAAYKNVICDWTSYNDEAADDSKETPYGDPWQLIWVFDGDETTNVVCEGYAKAFKYLCDLSSFSSSRVYCYLVSGMMAGGSGEGRHMWNIIRMDDNKNYLVNVTNCDTGTIGNPEYLFLKGYTASEQINAEDTDSDDNTISYQTTKYTFNINDSSISYYYGYDTETLYDSSELSISDGDYDPSVIIVNNGHYMAFATDRHGNTSAIGEAMSAMNEYPVEYVSMIGDMVGSGGSDAPTYDTTVVLNEVKAVFPWLTNNNVSIVYGSHDAGAVDNAGILKCRPAGSSAHIYTGYDDNGAVSYYIYGIAYDDMLNASYAKTSAENFRHWVDYEAYDKSVPIIVLCHVPIHAKRGDNKGASYWNAALNYAATGSDNGTEVRRNVVFLHGHNHTSEQVEYYYEPGATISVQKDTGSSSGSRPGGSSSASGESSVIYYTYITAGYLKQMSTKNATLIHLDDDALTFTKYNSGTPSVLGTAAHIHKENLPGPETLSFNGDNLAIDKNQTESIWSYLTQTEDELNGSNLTVTSSNLSVISCEGESITALKGGTAVITVRTDNGKEASAEFTVKAYAESIDFVGESAVTIRRGESAKLECVLSPTDEILCEKAVWSVTGQDGVVELDQDGNITGIYIGETAVTASVSSGSITYTVKVVTAITSVAFGEDSYEMAYGTTNDVAGEVSWLPAEEDPGVLTYETDNPDVVTVEGSILQAVNGGVANITVKADNGLEDTAEFTVIRFADGISPVGDTSLNLKPGDTYTPECDLYTEDGSDVYGDSVTWTIQSMTDDCISVDESTGKITALNAGDAEVTGYTANGASVTYFVHVIQELTEFAFGESYYEIDYGYEFNVMDYLTYAPENAEFEIVSVTSTNSDVLKVDGFNLTASAKGTATVTVTADNGKTAEADFRVFRYAEGIRKESADTVYLQPEEEEQLKYVLLPKGEEFDDEVIWTQTSDIQDNITLNQSGYVTAKNYGNASVRAETALGYAVDYYIVVYNAPEDLQFYRDTNYIRPGSYTDIWNYISTNTDYAAYAPVTVTSDKTDVIEIDGMNLKAVGNGSAQITVSYGEELTRTAEFNVGEYAESISRETGGDIYIRPGSEKTLDYILYPEDASMNDETVTWKLSDDCGGIFELADGVLTANNTDSLYAATAIQASISNGDTLNYDVHLYTDPESFRFINEENYLRINSGRSVWAYLSITPEEVSRFPVTVEAVDPDTVAVSYDYLSGVKKGSSLIIVTDEYGNSVSANFTAGYYADQINHDGDQSAELEIGETFTPKYYYFAYDEGDCSDEKVTWSIYSMTNDCISLDLETGQVTAVNGGEAVIRATIKNGTYIDYGIRVRTPFNNVQFSEESYEISYENTYDITDFITYEPEDADFEKLTITSLNPDIVSVSDNYLNALSRGTAKVIITTDNGLSTSADFKVVRFSQGIMKKDADKIYLQPEEELQLEYILTPEGETFDDEVVFQLDYANNDCITVDQNGHVTANTYGDAHVMAFNYYGQRVDYYINVYKYPDDLEFNKEEYYLRTGSTQDIWYCLSTDSEYIWGLPLNITSDDENVIRVEGNNLYPVGKGAATVTIWVSDDKNISAIFHVGQYAESISRENYETVYIPNGKTVSLEYTLYPAIEDCADEEIQWEIEQADTELITMDEPGVITTVKSGTVGIYARITNGEFVYYTVKTYTEPDGIKTLKEVNYLPLENGYNLHRYVELSPVDDWNCPLTAVSEHDETVHVDDGTVYGIEKGEATVTVSIPDGSSTDVHFVTGYYASGIEAEGSTETSLRIGDKAEFSYRLYGSDWSDDHVTWSVTDGEDYVSVNPDSGEVTALAAGTGVIRAETMAGFYVEYNVYVSDILDELYFNSDTYEMRYGEDFYLQNVMIYSPQDVDQSVFTVSSSNPDAVEVDGLTLHAVGRGTSKITVTAGKLKTEADIIVRRYAEGIMKKDADTIYLQPEEKIKLEYILTPKGETFDDEVTWTCSDPDQDIITLDEYGNVIANNYGSVNVQATTFEGLSVDYYIVVYKAPEDLQFYHDKNYIRPDSYTYIWNYIWTDTENAAYGPVTVTSDKTDVIEIDGMNLKAVGNGSAQITVSFGEELARTAEFIVGEYAENISRETWEDIYIKPGGEKTLEYILYPEGISMNNETVTWNLSDDCGGVFELADGVIKANNTDVLYANTSVESSITNGSSVTYNIYLYTDPKSFVFRNSENYVRIYGGYSIWDYLAISPEEIQRFPVTLESEDSEKIHVEGDALFPTKEGTVQMTVTDKYGNSVSADFTVGYYADQINHDGDQSAELEIGETFTPKYYYFAYDEGDCSDEKVTWSIESMTNDCISLNSETGEVTAVNGGEAVIRATIKNGTYIEYGIRIGTPLENVRFTEESYEINCENTYSITDFITYEPADADISSIIFTSDHPDIIDIVDNTVIAKDRGTAVITASLDNLTVSAVFTVYRYADGIRVAGDGSVYVRVGGHTNLGYTLEPEDEEFDDEIVWEIGEIYSGSFTLDDQGNVTGESTGQGYVTATTHNGYQIQYNIYVYELPDGISFGADSYNMKLEDSMDIWNYLIPDPYEAYGCAVTVTSSDESVISIDGKTLNGVGKGQTTITVTTENGLSDSAEFTVANYADSIEKANNSTIYLKPTEVQTLAYVLYPDDQANEDEVITWDLHDPENSPVTLEQNGTVTAKPDVYGYTYVTATITNGSSVTYDIYVYDDPEAVNTHHTEYYLRPDEWHTVWEYIYLSPDDSLRCPVTVTCEPEDIISIDGEALTSQVCGTAKISVSAENGESTEFTLNVGYYANEIWAADSQSIILNAGESYTPVCQLYAYDEGPCSDEKVTWSVLNDDNNCISIDGETGRITALRQGSATVRAAIKNGQYIEYDVTVSPEIESIQFRSERFVFEYWWEQDIWQYLTYSPYDANRSSITITSDRPDILSVTDQMLVPISTGTANITVETVGGLSTTAEFTVKKTAQNIERIGDFNRKLAIGDECQLQYKLLPENEDLEETVTWRLGYNNNNCIELSETGYVKAIQPGDASISAVLWNGLEASYHIEVYEAPTKIAFREHPSYTRVGAYINLMTLLDIEPAGAADAPLTIFSSDESVIKIDGVVIQVLKDGRAEVTVTADNGVSDTVEFITGNYAESIDYPDTYFNVCVGSERQLKYLLSPDPSEADLSDEEVTWSIVEGSENITIDNNGLVKGVKTGTAVVRASIRSGQYLEYHLTVIEAPHSVSFSRERIGFASESQFWIQEYLNMDPYEARYATGMTVSFSNPGILSEPNGDGYLVAVGRGRTNVTVTLDNGLTASAEFVVGNIADGINGSGISGAMIVGDSASIGYSLYADGHGTEDEVVTWSLVGGEPSDCVTIAQDGTVTANKAGYAYVRAQILNGEYTEFYVRVVEKPDRLAFSANDLYFSLNRYDGDEGYYYNIKDYLTGYPWELPVTGSSSDKNVIEFDSNNINFETKSKGSALVTAEGINGLKATAVFHTGWYALGISTDYLAYVEKGGQRQIIPSFGDPGLINASDEVITWSSDDESIATVDANGVVTGVSPGKTIIKAKILNGSEAWTYTYVYEKPTSVRFKNPKLYMNLNYDQFTPITEYLDIEPEGAKYADYTITTDNVDVISVSDRDIYGVQNGTANVTVTIDGLSTSAQFTAGYYATYICPKNSSFERINVDDTVQLETYMEASGGDFSDDRITWKVSSSDPQGCISVDTTGLVTANSIGTGTVTAETLCGYSAVFTIDVVEDIQTIRFNRDRLYLAVDSNRSVWDYLDVEPYSSAYTRVEVTSSEGNIVEIKDGMWLHAAAPGDAVITVRTKNNVAASVPVTVGYYASDIDSDETDVAILFGQEKQLKFDLISDSGQPITDEELEWTIIDNPDHCISLSDDGRIKAINYGSAVVQVFTRNRSWVRYCIDVIHNPERISFDKAEYYLPKDSSETLYLTSQPDQSSFIRYIFTSSDETVAEIEYDGHLHSSVKYVSDGTATIRAVSPYDGTVYAECKVTAYTPESATDIDVQDHLTGYAGYILNVPFKLVPVTAEKDITVTFSNNNISLEKIIGDRAWLKCESTGTTNVTFTAASGISKSVEVNVIDGVPEFDASLTVFEYGDNYLAPVKGTSQVNLDQYTFIVGKTYGFSVLYDIAGKTASVPSYNDMFNSLQKYTVQTDLFDQIGQGYGYAADSYSVQIPAKAVRAGTLEAEFIPGRKVLLKVADYAQAQNTVNVSETIEPETASSITEAIESNDDAFGISDELRNAAAEVTIPEDIQVSEGEKIIVETHLDINVTDLKKEEDGTASLAVNIEPKYQIKTVNENTGAETEVTSPSILEVNEPVTITIPVGDAFKDRDVKTVLVKHTKEDGTVYTYKGIYQDGTVTFVNPDGFSDFEIIVLDDSYDNDPVYTWEETEDGWKVTGTITSTLGKVIKEETEAVRTVYYDATCTQGSVEIYEAVFRNQMFARQMKEIRTEALGHSYVLSRWQWNDDLTEAYAVFRCTVCDHEESVKADVSVNEYGSTATVLFMDKEYIDTCNAGPSPVLEITVTPDTLKLGIKETSQLTAMVIGADEGTEVIWKSLSPDIASVDSNGLVTAKMPGTAVIHAMIAEKEDIYAECTVIVEDDYILRNIAFRHSCSFGNDLSINYYTPMADLEGYENIRMEVRKQIFEKDGSISWETTELANYTQSNPDGDDYYRFAYTGIAAKEMGSEVRMVLLCEKDGHTYTTEDDVYGIGTYAYNRLEASTDNTFKTLIVDMLNYGAKAQEYFNYNKTNLVNAALTEEQKALGTQTDPELKSVEKVTETAGATATFYGKSAVFNSNVELKYYMQFAETQNLKNVKLVLTYIAIDGTAYKEEIKAGDFGYDTSKKAYTAKLISIAAKDVGCTVTAKIYDGSKLISNTLEYSLETYAYNRLIKSTDEVFKAFIKAFMKYGFSAEAYFRSKNPNN